QILRHWPLALVILWALLAYSNSFHGPFVLDNDELIRHDTRIQAYSAANLQQIFARPYYPLTPAGLYRPVTTLTYLLNFAVLDGGIQPEPYHALNFAVHAINVCLVYALGWLLFRNRFAAAACSLLWAVHPVLTESVTNIAGRADLLAAMGAISALLCYRSALAGSGPKRFFSIAGIAAGSFVAVWSKESGIVVIAALVALDLIFLRSISARMARAAALSAAAFPIVAYLIVRDRVLAQFPAAITPFVDNPLTGGSFWAGRITAFRVIGQYLSLLVWPARLSADYSFAQIPVQIDLWGLLSLTVCALAAILACAAVRRNRPLAFSIFFFFLSIAPVSNVFALIGSIMAERFLYLPAVGFVFAVVAAVSAVVTTEAQRRKFVAAAVCGVALMLSVRTFVRNRDWSDEQRFWASMAQTAPDSYKGHMGYALQLPVENAAEQALAAAEIGRATQILAPLRDEKTAGMAYHLAGIIYRKIGEQLAVQSGADAAAGWYDRSLAELLRYREITEASLKAENRSGPTLVPADVYGEIARSLVRKNDLPGAVSFYEQARLVEAEPNFLDEEGQVLAAIGSYRQAAQVFLEVVEADGSRTDLLEKIVDMYTKTDGVGCAVDRENRLNPACPPVHADICAAAGSVEASLARHGQLQDAAASHRNAVLEYHCAATQ
ncbi:MAG: hypothetical protein C5B56_07450, partial [Proteobacteria bacterium]